MSLLDDQDQQCNFSAAQANSQIPEKMTLADKTVFLFCTFRETFCSLSPRAQGETRL